tara:strand:+ start:292 stop:534 length:243 start_codon:yes stop_codon:yes gene_type:complete
MSNKIKTVHATDGGLQFVLEDNTWLKPEQDPNYIRILIVANGILDNFIYGSSMDFASEYGFANNDDARKLFDKSIGVDNE